MAWFTRYTRFGDMHLVFGQEQNISCGIASVIMAAFKINKLKPGTKAAFDEFEIMTIAKALLGPNPLKGDGLDSLKMLKLLNHPILNMVGWKHYMLPPKSVPQELIKRVEVTSFGPTLNVKPMIVGIDWLAGKGHWVVVDTVRMFGGDFYATVCDPWDANVHVVRYEKNNIFGYNAKEEIVFNFGGKKPFGYSRLNIGGCFIGDVLWRD